MYNFDAVSTRIALEQMGKSTAPKMMSYAQQSTLASRLISDRLSAKDFSNDVRIKFSKDRGKIYGANSAFIYVDGGQVRNKPHRRLNALGLGTSAKYHGKIFEIGGEYKRDLTHDKSYHLSPFIGLQMSHMKQNAYSERGADWRSSCIRRRNLFAKG